MQQVQLFGKKESVPASPSAREKRPPKIAVSKVISANHKWRQCKIIGKNISIRSYSAACYFKNRVYLHGGYQILNGSLQDFYSISLDDQEKYFNWQEILVSGANPGRRSKHSLVASQSHIYLIGGLISNDTASKDIWKFSPLQKRWELVKPQGIALPPLESFGAVLVKAGDEEKIVIACGFDETVVSPVNTVYQYNLTHNKLSILFEGTQKGSQNVPIPRHGLAITTDHQNIYLFGGKSETTRLNDFWKFSLTDFKYHPMKNQGMVPNNRNGHTLNYHNNKLYVFGGIHDITWQLDDLHIYDLHTEKWTTLQQDSPRKLEKKKKQTESIIKEAKSYAEGSRKSPTNRRGWETGMAKNSIHTPSSPGKGMSLTYNEDARAENSGRMLDEQRRKVFYQKKAQMLKNFQISKEETKKLVVLQTSSQAMKNSLDVIGNPDPNAKVQQDRLTDFGKESVSKFLAPLHDHSNFIVGKKPCARDGHCGVMIDGQLVVLGGDRHQMSFNDIYKLNLKLAEKDLPIA